MTPFDPKPVGSSREMLHLRVMTDHDVPLGMRLTEQAGWNQTAADWRRFLEMEPEGCFVAEADGRPVATATACTFHAVGWIAMVLVDEAVRRRGIGTALVRQTVDYLDRRSVATARLDATPLGQTVYGRLGFAAECELVRLEGVAPAGPPPHPNVRPAAQNELDAVLALDRQITGTRREKLFEHILRRQPGALHVFSSDSTLTGYLMFREGSRAAQIGPGVATSEEAGRALGDALLARCAGQPVFIDVPRANTPAIRWAESRGLRVQRPFTRMRRGPAVHDHPAQLWASSGPEHG